MNKDKELLQGLVLVWGNDYQKTKNEQSKIKYIDNFTRLNEINEQLYKEEIKNLQTPYTNLEEEEKRLTELIKVKEKYLALKAQNMSDYQTITNETFNFLSSIDDTDLNDLKNKLEAIRKYLNNLKELEKLRKENNEYNQQLLDINELLISNENTNSELEDQLLSYFDQNFAIPFNDDTGYQERNKIITIYDERIELIEKYMPSISDKAIKQEKDTELSKIKFENFNLKNQIMLYDIKKLLEEKHHKYLHLKEKRDQILKLLNQREELIKTYQFQVYSDDYNEFINLVNKQLNDLEPQKEALDNKDKIDNKLNTNITKIEKLEKENAENGINKENQNYKIEEEKEPVSFKEVPKLNEKEFDLDEFIKNNKKESEKEGLPSSLEEGLLKEEQNLEQILNELDIKLNQMPEKKEVTNPEVETQSEEIPNIEDVINELKKQYPTDLGEEKDDVKEENIKLESVEDNPKIENNNDNNFHGALDSITNILDEEDESEDSFVFTGEDDNSLLSILSNNDSSQLDFLNGEALDNILNDNTFKNEE